MSRGLRPDSGALKWTSELLNAMIDVLINDLNAAVVTCVGLRSVVSSNELGT